MAHNDKTNLPDTGDAGLAFQITRHTAYTDEEMRIMADASNWTSRSSLGQEVFDRVDVKLVEVETVVETSSFSYLTANRKEISREVTPGMVGEESYVDHPRNIIFWVERTTSTRFHTKVVGAKAGVSVDPDTIYKTAEELLATYRAEQTQEAYVESFVGFYPPKRMADR